ncbi:hypothetical protein HYS47_02385 [Candidatus Woesearchaeota archaeon]|nr:hypothetical protein [Candidatus Woesearchaeota archaeon]
MTLDRNVTAFYHLHRQVGEKPSPLLDPHTDLQLVKGSRVMYNSGVGEITQHPLYAQFKDQRIYAARYNGTLVFHSGNFSCHPGQESARQDDLEQQLEQRERHVEVLVTQVIGQQQPAITLYRHGEALSWAMGWLKRQRGSVQRLELYLVQHRDITYLPWSYAAGTSRLAGNGKVLEFPRTSEGRDLLYKRRMETALRDANRPGRRAGMIAREEGLANMIEDLRNPPPAEPAKPRNMELFPSTKK